MVDVGIGRNVTEVVAIVAVVAATVAGFVVWQRRAPTGGKALRDVLTLALVTAAFALSSTMLAKAVGTGSMAFAAIHVFVVLGWTAFALAVVPLETPAPLRGIRAWELSGVRYRRFGVAAFGAVLRNSPLRHLSPAVYLRKFLRDPSSIRGHLETAEAIHFWGSVFTIPYLMYAAWHGWWGVLILCLALHACLNLYPILHLRMVRARISNHLCNRPVRGL